MKIKNRIEEIRKELIVSFPGISIRQVSAGKKRFGLSAISKKKLKPAKKLYSGEITEITFQAEFKGEDGVSIRRVFRYLLDSAGKKVKTTFSR